ncbi:hypothetical protein NADFUDRAFT_84198, partial [Nadsonia fulvescens var. elongata DSM 6958]
MVSYTPVSSGTDNNSRVNDPTVDKHTGNDNIFTINYQHWDTEAVGSAYENDTIGQYQRERVITADDATKRLTRSTGSARGSC